MEYWLSVADELSDQIGVEFCDAQRNAAASIMKSAAEVHGEYTSVQEPLTPPVRQPTIERKLAWWEDTSQLVGADWVLANQIHALINQR